MSPKPATPANPGKPRKKTLFTIVVLISILIILSVSGFFIYSNAREKRFQEGLAQARQLFRQGDPDEALLRLLELDNDFPEKDDQITPLGLQVVNELDKRDFLLFYQKVSAELNSGDVILAQQTINDAKDRFAANPEFDNDIAAIQSAVDNMRKQQQAASQFEDFLANQFNNLFTPNGNQ